MLIGEAVCLAPLFRDDGPLLFNWRNDLALQRANGPYRPISQASFENWFNPDGDPTRVVFSIRERPNLRLLGFLQLINIQAGARSAELGVMIGASGDRNRGYGGEAVRLALDYAWRELNLQRVGLFVFGDNPGAIRAYVRAGFEVEGVMRRAAYIDGAYSDVTVMGCLRHA